MPVALHAGASEPLPAQLVDQMRALVGSGVLAPGDAVPSTRALAAHLEVARGTVVAAYDQLLAEGYLLASPGRSTVVNPQVRGLHPREPKPRKSRPPRPTLLDLSPGQPWSDDVVGAAWRAAWRQASASPLGQTVPPAGLLELRRAWSEHLRRMRGVVRDPDQIAVTAGGREGLSLVLLALRPAVATKRPLRVGVEDPGYPSLRRVPARLGATTVPLPVDEHGLRVADLPTDDVPDVVLVTPSHQYPLGGSLPVDRREALLEWAHEHGVVVVEDDYDSELRYTSQPLPALASLDDPDAGVVVLLGTLSKLLTPALATGFLALPRSLVPAILAARADLGTPVGLVSQRAVAHYLDSGALRLHTQRVRNRYRRRRAQVVAALAGAPGATVFPMDGGLHAVVETARPEADVVAALAAEGVKVSPLSQYWAGSSTRQGIVFGFGAVGESDLAGALKLIRAQVDDQPASGPDCHAGSERQ